MLLLQVYLDLPCISGNKQNIYSVAFSPQANYTDRATAIGRRNLVPTFADRGYHVVKAAKPPAVNLSFLDRSRYFFFQVAPHLSSRGWMDPVPGPVLLKKSGRAGKRTRDLWVCSQELWPLDHRGGALWNIMLWLDALIAYSQTRMQQPTATFESYIIFCFRT
jgi:hypothetical protein